MFVMRRLESVAEAVVLGDSKDERLRILKERLNAIVLPTTFKLPLSPHLNVSVVLCVFFRSFAASCGKWVLSCTYLLNVFFSFLFGFCCLVTFTDLRYRCVSLQSDGVEKEAFMARIEGC